MLFIFRPSTCACTIFPAPRADVALQHCIYSYTGFAAVPGPFFRVPNRKLTISENAVIARPMAKVVVIEETTDEEYFKGKRLQVSIFKEPANVHVNRNPVSGEVVYNQYRKGQVPRGLASQIFHRK